MVSQTRFRCDSLIVEHSSILLYAKEVLLKRGLAPGKLAKFSAVMVVVALAVVVQKKKVNVPISRKHCF